MRVPLPGMLKNALDDCSKARKMCNHRFEVLVDEQRSFLLELGVNDALRVSIRGKAFEFSFDDALIRD